VDIFGDINIDGNIYIGNYGIPSYSKYEKSSYPRLFKQEDRLDYMASLSDLSSGKVLIPSSKKVYKWGVTSSLPSFSNFHTKYLLNPLTYKNNYLLSEVSNLNNAFENNNKKNITITRGNYETSGQNIEVDFEDLTKKFTSAFTTKGISEITTKNCGLVTERTNKGTTTYTFQNYYGNFLNCSKDLEIVTDNAEFELSKISPDAKDLAQRGGIATLNNLTIKANNVKLKGTFLINGDLNISSANVLADAVFYVKGDVTVNQSDIHSLNYKNSKGEDIKGTLLIFSVGEIEFKAISAGSNDTVSNMKAFLYSKSDLKITGSTSNLIINGGISARSVELTGMRGTSNKSFIGSCKDYKDRVGCQSLTDLNTHWGTASYRTEVEKHMRGRLTIYYNPDIIITYQEYAVETAPVKVPTLTVTSPTDFDRSKK
jgi:hypothetical protein